MSPKDAFSDFDEHATDVGMTEEERRSYPQFARDEKGRFAAADAGAGQAPDPARDSDAGSEAQVAVPVGDPVPGPEPVIEQEQPVFDPGRLSALEQRMKEQADDLRRERERNDHLMRLMLESKSQPAQRAEPEVDPLEDIDPDVRAVLERHGAVIRKQVLAEIDKRIAPVEQTTNEARLKQHLQNTFHEAFNDEFYETFKKTVRTMPENERQMYDNPAGVEAIGWRVLAAQRTAPPTSSSPSSPAVSKQVVRAHSEASPGREPKGNTGKLTEADIMRMSSEQFKQYVSGLDRRAYGPDDKLDPLLR